MVVVVVCVTAVVVAAGVAVLLLERAGRAVSYPAVPNQAPSVTAAQVTVQQPVTGQQQVTVPPQAAMPSEDGDVAAPARDVAVA